MLVEREVVLGSGPGATGRGREVDREGATEDSRGRPRIWR